MAARICCLVLDGCTHLLPVARWLHRSFAFCLMAARICCILSGRCAQLLLFVRWLHANVFFCLMAIRICCRFFDGCKHLLPFVAWMNASVAFCPTTNARTYRRLSEGCTHIFICPLSHRLHASVAICLGAARICCRLSDGVMQMFLCQICGRLGVIHTPQVRGSTDPSGGRVLQSNVHWSGAMHLNLSGGIIMQDAC